MLRGVNKVTLYVADQDRAQEFWTQTLGFTLVQDTPYQPPYRWLEVAPPDQDVIVMLAPRDQLPPGLRLPDPGDLPPNLPTSWVWFRCEDIRETYRQLSARGVSFPEPPSQQFFGWWAVFEDPDGNRYALQERDEPSEGAA